MDKRTENRNEQSPVQHKEQNAGRQPQENKGADEMQTSYDRPLDKVEGEMNNGEIGLGGAEQHEVPGKDK